MPRSSLFELIYEIDIGMLEHTLIPCFAASKMLLVDEMGEKMKYEQIAFVEFLEFITRVADYKFKNMEISMY